MMSPATRTTLKYLGMCHSCGGCGFIHCLIDESEVAEVPCGWCHGLGDLYNYPEQMLRPADWARRQTPEYREPKPLQFSVTYSREA